MRPLVAGALLLLALLAHSAHSAASYQPIASLGTPRALFASSRVGSLLCVFGGLITADGCNSGTPLRSIECLDTAALDTAVWTPAPSALPEALFAMAAVTLSNGTVLLMGGRNSSGNGMHQSSATFLFFPNGTLVRGAELPYPVSSAVAAVDASSGDVFLTFGWKTVNFCRRTVAMLRMGAAEWTVSAVSRYSHCDHGIALGAEGRAMMFAGAADNAPALNTMNEYVSSQNRFRLWYKLTDARDLVLHASPGPGRALALGGRDPEMHLWRSVEALNTTHGWAMAPALALPVPLAAGAAHYVDAAGTLCVLGGFSTALKSSPLAWCRADSAEF